MKACIPILFILIFTSSIAFSQETSHSSSEILKHSIETSPFSPLLQMANKGIWAIKYEYALTPRDELKLGLAYMNLHFDEGITNSPALILGYRKYIYKQLYAEYELWPAYDAFYEKHEDTYYKGFDLWNEARIGYQFLFRIKNYQLFLNIAWPFGFGLYSSNKPDSFYERQNQSFSEKYFYHFPLIFIGAKF